MTIALAQPAVSNVASSSSTVTVTLGSPTTAGNCLVACVAGGAGATGGTVTSITLGGGADNWAALKTVGTLNGGAEALSVWADPNCAGGQTSVAITITGGTVVLAWVFEFSGIVTSSVLDQFGTFDSVGSSTGPAFSVSTGSPTTQATELAVGCVYGFNQTITGPSSPWVNESTLTSTTRNLQAGYQILSSTGTVTYSGTLGGATFNGQVLVTLKGVGAPAAPPAAPLPPVIPPHPLFARAVLEEAYQRADWQAQGVADLTVAFSSTSGGVDTYNVTSPYNGTGSHPMRVLAPTAPNPSFPHAFLIMLPVEPNQQTTYGDSIGTAQAIAAHNAWNLTCVQPGYSGAAPSGTGPWYADNPLNPAIGQEKFTLLVTAWIKQHLAITGTEQVYLIGFSKSALGGQNLLLRHPYTYAACASWDGCFAMTDYDGTDAVHGLPVGDNPGDSYGTSANFTNNYELSATRLSAAQGTGQYGINRVWVGTGPSFTSDCSWYDGALTSAGIPHTFTFSNTTETHAWQTDWVAAALQAIIPSNEPTVLPQQIHRQMLVQLLEAAEYRAEGGPPAAPPSVNASAGVAAVAASAPQASVSATSAAAPATVLAVAPAAAAAQTATAGVATALAAAPAASAAATATAGVPVVLASAPQASVSTSGGVNANAGVAAVAAAAPAPLPSATATAGAAAVLAAAPAGAIPRNAAVATVSATAPAPALALTASAAAGAVAVQAPAASGGAVAAFTVGTLTASTAPGGAGGTLTASDTRTGGPQ